MASESRLNEEASVGNDSLRSIRAITRSAYFWRTFLLLAGLVTASVVAVFAAYRLLEHAPPEQRLAWDVASIVNLTRSALLGSDPNRRMRMLEELAREEEVRVVPLEPSDRIDSSRSTPVLEALEARLRLLLGDRTIVAARVNDEDGVWVSFDLAGDAYWLLLPARRAERQIDPGLGVIALIAALFASGAALGIAWFVDRPLARLSRAIDLLGRGEMPPRLSEDGPRQLAQVNRQFNRMSRELAELEADRRLALAGISHDLRSPLTRLRMEVELAPLDAEQRDAMVEDIGRIDAIVGQFIDYARSTQAPRARLVDATGLLSMLADRYATEIRAGGMTLRTELGSAVAWHGDPTDLQRAATNLIDNALRHAQTPGTSRSDVEVQLLRLHEAIELQVCDHGPGIPEERLDEATRPFTRLDEARGDLGGVHPGTGLGLAIVFRIARRYGGALTLSRAATGGLCARVRLPDWHRSA